jgi:A/G-specific adenine glycosylase
MKPPVLNPKIVPALLDWFSKNARDLPWRRTQDPYAIWVSEIMLQQTQVKTVIPYWERWMRELPTIESLAKAKPEKIHKLWEGLGYYTRVRNMQKAAQEIVKSSSRRKEALAFSAEKRLEPPHVGCHAFPDNFEDVLALPGIGRYTAGAICSIAFNQPTPILDGNVIRVLTRVFGISENPREKKTNQLLWQLAGELVSRAQDAKSATAKKSLRTSRPLREPNSCSALNQSLMELGALICTPREPKCSVCPIAKHCFAFQKNRVDEFPNMEKRPAATARRFAAFVVECDGKFLVQQRPEGVVNAHLWEFPNVELNGEPVNPSASVNELFGFTPKEVNSLCTIKHSITRYRITVEAFRIGAPSTCSARANHDQLRPSRCSAFPARWLPLSELHKLSFPSAHKSILKAITAKVEI